MGKVILLQISLFFLSHAHRPYFYGQTLTNHQHEENLPSIFGL